MRMTHSRVTNSNLLTTDGDGVGNNADDDDDGDGVNDIDDPTPQGENNPPTFDNPPPLISVPENQIFVHPILCCRF